MHFRQGPSRQRDVCGKRPKVWPALGPGSHTPSGVGPAPPLPLRSVARGSHSRLSTPSTPSTARTAAALLARPGARAGGAAATPGADSPAAAEGKLAGRRRQGWPGRPRCSAAGRRGGRARTWGADRPPASTCGPGGGWTRARGTRRRQGPRAGSQGCVMVDWTGAGVVQDTLMWSHRCRLQRQGWAAQACCRSWAECSRRRQLATLVASSRAPPRLAKSLGCAQPFLPQHLCCTLPARWRLNVS